MILVICRVSKFSKLYRENKKEKEAFNFNCERDSIRKKRKKIRSISPGIILEIYKKRKFNYLFVQPIRQLIRS